MTKLTLEIDGTICSMEIPYNDASATELIKGFGSLMIGQTFLACTVKEALEEVAEDYEEDLKIGYESQHTEED